MGTTIVFLGRFWLLDALPSSCTFDLFRERLIVLCPTVIEIDVQDLYGVRLRCLPREHPPAIVWPHFVIQTDPSQQSQAPNTPDPDELK